MKENQFGGEISKEEDSGSSVSNIVFCPRCKLVFGPWYDFQGGESAVVAAPTDKQVGDQPSSLSRNTGQEKKEEGESANAATQPTREQPNEQTGKSLFDRAMTEKAIHSMIRDLRSDQVVELWHWLRAQYPPKKKYYGVH